MLSTEELRRQLINPFNIVAILSFVLGILNLVLVKMELGLWQTILSALFVLALVFLVLIAATRYVVHRKLKPTLQFYRNHEEAPNKYGRKEILKQAQNNNAELEIAARTAFRWLCGDEREYREDRERFDATQKTLLDEIRQCVVQGASINFTLQNPHTRIPYFDQRSHDLLKEHLKEAIRGYEIIRNNLEDAKGTLALSFSEDVIENSIVRLKVHSKLRLLIFDLSVGFKSNGQSRGKLSKPFLVYKGSGGEFERFAVEFLNSVKGRSVSKVLFDSERRKAIDKAERLIAEFPYHSRIRGDNSSRLANKAAEYLLAERNVVENPPPVSIHLSITNKCTTECTMCDHHKLYKREHELNRQELYRVLDCISRIGTKCVIISGGEPLARDEVFDVLKYGKRRKLRLALLTNGVGENGKPLNSEEAKIVADTCEWVQLSIDSFDKNTYKEIRGTDCLDAAVESLKLLLQLQANVEIAYTIQKKNIREVSSIFNLMTQVGVPPSAKLRAKIAHGPFEERNGREDFLCEKHELQEMIRNLPIDEKFKHNFQYLRSMMEDKYFDFEGLSRGLPLSSRMIRYESLGYKCHALRLTCMVDSNGEVYPCCFLFDDNRAASDIRRKYSLGSLRLAAGVVPSPSEDRNPLADVWYTSGVLQELRARPLPVDELACRCCTRHFYQNEFLNEICGVYEEYKRYGVAERFLEEGESADFFM
jgi:MoaA/NifB/PqqE/SkfB family radical SAM enzyme